MKGILNRYADCISLIIQIVIYGFLAAVVMEFIVNSFFRFMAFVKLYDLQLALIIVIVAVVFNMKGNKK